MDFSDIDSADRFLAWVNPTIGVPPPSELSALINATGNFEVGGSNVSFTAQGDLSGQSFIDEIRLGETFGDVTPISITSSIPEPRFFHFVGIIIGVAILLQRKRRISDAIQ